MNFFLNHQHCFAYPNKSIILCRMSFRARITFPLLFIPFLTQCGSRSAPTTNAVTGPFDSRGNYVEEWVDSPEKWYRPAAPSSRSKPTTAPRDPAPQQIAVVEHRPSPAVSAPAPKSVAANPKPKPVVVKPKPKPPTAIKYIVKRGDSLSRIASRNGISLSSLRRANGISGDIIRPGQVLKIPK
ncbi:MAG: hypothetical protein RLZZ505_2489 [Verrucomicrobiota bacterium]|jgi:nucleoid-associated protein YgaU